MIIIFYILFAMPKDIKATDAVRNFSEILSSIKYRGEKYRILRGGKPVAVMSAIEPAKSPAVLRDLPALLAGLPVLGDEAEDFARDLVSARKEATLIPEDGPWE
jgi:antitoxin (DNA-binding transcriptional repressor) of toxin-antitoxin stability system